MKIDPTKLTQQDSSHLLTDIIVPRPIAWVSTVDEHGIFNLAPFSAYGMISAKPMVIGFSVSSKRDGQKKDTLKNIELIREFVINTVTEDLAEAMNITSAPYPSDVSEFKKAELTPIKAELVKVPLVAESSINMECCVIRIMEFGKPPLTTSLIIGEVLRVHVADEFYDNLNRRVSRIKAVARLGGDGDLYCRTQDMFQMKRPAIE